MLNFLHFHISTFRIMCAVPNTAVFRSYVISEISWMILRWFKLSVLLLVSHLFLKVFTFYIIIIFIIIIIIIIMAPMVLRDFVICIRKN
jgi:predicted lysophospholipase L1 biosynthesis ABC-type transport system permease subunit